MESVFILSGGVLFGVGFFAGWKARTLQMSPVTIKTRPHVAKKTRWNPADPVDSYGTLLQPITPQDQREERELKKPRR